MNDALKYKNYTPISSLIQKENLQANSVSCHIKQKKQEHKLYIEVVENGQKVFKAMEKWMEELW